MKTKRLLPILMILLLGLLGCASSPEPRFYLLSPVAESAPLKCSDPDISVLPDLGTASLGITAITLPEAVDRPQLVWREGTGGVRVDAHERWAGSLKDQIPRLLAENLSRLTGNAQIAAYPAVAAERAAYRLAIDVQQFSGYADGRVVVDAHWAWVPRRGEVVLQGREVAVRQVSATDDMTAWVMAYNQALAAVSEAIVRAWEAQACR